MPAPQRSSAQLLATPVQFLKGVGPHRAEMLNRLGLCTARDVLFFFPRDYEDLTNESGIANLKEGELQTVRGVIEEVELRNTGPGRSVLGVLVRAEDGHIRAVWFNQPSMVQRFSHGQRVILSGKPKLNGLFWEMSHPKAVAFTDEEPEPARGLLAVYPLTEGLKQHHVRHIVRQTLEFCAGCLDEVFPARFLADHDLLPLAEALPKIHSPADADELARVRRRFIYQEFLILQLALSLRRTRQHDLRKAPPLEATAKIDARIRRLFPFELTAGQEQAIAEIAADMNSAVPMNRLLQGDVGSGKTVVAVYAMLLAVACGHQAVLMAPTEILARQHSITLDRMLAQSSVRRGQLVGGLSPKQRAATLDQIAAGEIDLLVGTQAILQEDVAFKRLGLVIIDEQHKFGVRQRATLKQAGPAIEENLRTSAHGAQESQRTTPGQAGPDPHYLVMTATPIPRSVTMTLFGDLDVSTLRDAPPGRQKVNTYLTTDDLRDRWWKFFGEKLREGRQGYVITPLVEESDQIAAKSVDEAFEALANGPLEEFRLGLIHGRMSTADKDAVMSEFRLGRLQVLVSTSVVEVGVDVPNATVMTIESGERFGLAQLHQLRGRISRGRQPGFCAVFADPQTEDAQRRLKAFTKTTDGFELAELDFQLRGPGELFGTRQHGLPPFRIADLARDEALLNEARRDAQSLTQSDPTLTTPENTLLRRMLLARYGKVLDLGDVG